MTRTCCPLSDLRRRHYQNALRFKLFIIFSLNQLLILNEDLFSGGGWAESCPRYQEPSTETLFPLCSYREIRRGRQPSLHPCEAPPSHKMTGTTRTS